MNEKGTPDEVWSALSRSRSSVPPFIRSSGHASMPTFLPRRVTFAAAHRYRVAEWSDERNAETFGACARPNYHGHSYVCDVTVTGEIDPVTGFVADLGVIDRVL